MTDTIDDVDEHPIIFNEWSINRILAGEKTQTRRIVNPQPDPDRELEIYPYYYDRPVLDGMKYDNRWALPRRGRAVGAGGVSDACGV